MCAWACSGTARYTHQLPQSARALVDETTNCDDILFNFMVANTTGSAPVFVGTAGIAGVHAKRTVDADGNAAGLFNRRRHTADRDACLGSFSRLFGGMRLRYTSVVFQAQADTAAPLPLPKHHASSACVPRSSAAATPAPATPRGQRPCYLVVADVLSRRLAPP